MNSIIKTNNLSFYNDYGTLTLSAKQYDTGRKFNFRIMNEDEPFDLTGLNCYIRIKKSDGTEFQGHDCCVINGCDITIDTSLSDGVQILASDGINLCELHLSDENNVSLTSWTFIIDVEKRVHNGDNLNSIDSWDRLDSILQLRTVLSEHLENTSNVENKSSEMIRNEITKDNVTNALGYTPYTPYEIDNKFSTLETNIDWKEAVNTFDDITINYPNPEDGWTVNTKDTDYTYRFNGEDWICISANAIPKATETMDGLFTKQGYSKLQSIENGAEINQNSFSKISNNTRTIVAGEKEDVLVLNGDNVNLTFDTENNKITFSIQKEDVINALGYTPGSTVDNNTTYTLTKSNGKIVLTGSDGYVAEVNDDNTVYVHPTTPGNYHIPSGGNNGNVLKWADNGIASWGNLTASDVGALASNANAVSADKATQDGSGNVITDTYATKTELNSAIGDISFILNAINRTEI